MQGECACVSVHVSLSSLKAAVLQEDAAPCKPAEHVCVCVCVCCIQELRDRNDELSSELELLKSNRKCRRSAGDGAALSWSQQRAESDSGN